ncbi:hypothetical protein [Oxalicibacterium faecigallinarum]|uniref:Uncharacterized protein n=1 Tax=Oxalicibacterium faecigallinarum TaxID=573741 RepID=A0A8J3AMF1_9BURK|nr:hypothetical protein [Oxalicibacterium faecigallinarum]GGI16418.1 hypothetical protein GCM10008066_03860 [Oxalicibacterium faecigallinarum]
MTNQTNQPTAIFTSVGQALHVAYLIMASDARQDSPLRKALVRMMSDIDLSAQQTEWLNQLRGEATGTVNFAGLSADDVRAQCALIVSAVDSKLMAQEKWVIHAKYMQMVSTGSKTTERQRSAQQYVKFCQHALDSVRIPMHARRQQEELEEAQRQLDKLKCCPAVSYSTGRVDAIKGLSEWLAGSFPTINVMALDMIVAKIYANHVKTAISYRDLEKTFGSSKSTYARIAPAIKDRLYRLELIAQDRLRPYFEEQGIVEVFEKTA